MSVHVTRMLLVIMAVYATGLAAFAFAFHILMPGNTSFYNPATASLKVLVMMIGEFDFEDNFMWRNDEVLLFHNEHVLLDFDKKKFLHFSQPSNTFLG